MARRLAGAFFHTRVTTPRMSTSSISNICPVAVRVRFASSIDIGAVFGMTRLPSLLYGCGVVSGATTSGRAAGGSGAATPPGVGQRWRFPAAVLGVEGDAGGHHGVDLVQGGVGQGDVDGPE